MKKNKLILFDWGNIVEKHKSGYTLFNAYDDLFKDLGFKGDNIFECLGKYHMTTINNIDEFKLAYNQIKDDLNLNVEFDEFLKKYNDYCDKIDFYQDVRDFEVSLKEQCFIGIFSNLYIIDKNRLDKQVKLSNYDYIFLSFELGLRKPDINCFKEVNEKVPFKGDDILFIDDRLDNVLVAKQIGWNAYCLDGSKLDEIKKLCIEFLNK